MHPKNVKGAQPEQLVDLPNLEPGVPISDLRKKARRLISDPNYEKSGYAPRKAELAEWVVALATALSECRERLEHIAENADSFHKGEDGKAKALAVIADWARGGPFWQDFQRALTGSSTEGVAQPPSEASERSGTA